MKKTYWQIILIFLLISVANAEEIAPPSALEKVQATINELQQQMQDNRSQVGKLQIELETAEKNIGQIAKTLNKLNQQVKEKSLNLQQLFDYREDAKKQLKLQREQLAKQIRTTYAIGRQDYLKLLLNQENTESVGRIIAYYELFNRARADKIKDIHELLNRLDIIETDIQQNNVQMEQLISEQNTQKTTLQTKNEERKKLLKNLNDAYKTQAQKLQALKDDKFRLEKLVGKVQKVLVENTPKLPENTPPDKIKKLQTPLLIPVKGKTVRKFGETKESGIKSQGILISATAGEKVQAVAAGRVVFADWFRHLGQLIIIEHSEGYMSLYGHNQTLLTHIGAQVESGETIATVGDSGGQENSGLYFEWRRQGAAIDPSEWFAKLN
jgi:septal ring factor EnvC (AmiA/AmiB activator)